jgi:hypothetical protein
MFRLRTARLSCALLALSIGPGFATVVTYSDMTAWQNATAPGFNTITFDSLGTPAGAPYTTGLVIGDGTTFYGAANGTGQLWVYNQTPGPGNYYNYGSGSILVGPVYQGGSFIPYINITLPFPVTSVGFNIMTVGTGGISFNAQINNGTVVYTSAPTFAWSATNPQLQFFGFTTTSDSPITSLLLSLPTSAMFTYPALDNFSYGNAASAPSDTPEACTLLLIGMGLVGMRLFRRRLRKVAVPVQRTFPDRYGAARVSQAV